MQQIKVFIGREDHTEELENDVRETQRRLNELQAVKDENQKFVLSAEQQAEIRKTLEALEVRIVA